MTSSLPNTRVRFRSAWMLAVLPAAALLFAGTAVAQSRVIGWIDAVGAGPGAQASVPPVRITRKGAEIGYDANDGLRSCDRLRLVDHTAVVRITLSNKERIRLDGKTSEATLPCDPAGVTEQLAAFLRAVWGSAETRRVNATAAASRTRSRTAPPVVPALVGDRSEVGAGDRALYIAWKGGEPPFTVRIIHQASDAILTTVQNVPTRSATLPSARYAPGRHVLTVIDAQRRTLRDEQLHVVDASALPPLPRALADATIPEDAKRLYYADFLAGFGDGQFCLEALQQAASISPRTAAARDWLEGWGDPE